MGLKLFCHYKRIHSATSIHVSSHLLGGCESLLLVDADATACPRPMEGLPAPAEALPVTYVPPFEASGDWTLRRPPEGGAWTRGRPLDG